MYLGSIFFVMMIMRIFIKTSFLLLFLFSFPGCNKSIKPNELPANIAIGEIYYSQFAIRYEKGRHVTTNYRRGGTIAVNTPLKLVSINKKTIEVEVQESGQRLNIVNIQKHTGDDVYQAFDKLFAKLKVNLRRFSALERNNIELGKVVKGMRKKAVLVAIGYPPITKTPDLNGNDWTYWQGRYNTFRVQFKNDKVVGIID